MFRSWNSCHIHLEREEPEGVSMITKRNIKKEKYDGIEGEYH